MKTISNLFKFYLILKYPYIKGCLQKIKFQNNERSLMVSSFLGHFTAHIPRLYESLRLSQKIYSNWTCVIHN